MLWKNKGKRWVMMSCKWRKTLTEAGPTRINRIYIYIVAGRVSHLAVESH